MLEELFGSRTRIKLLKLFLSNPEEKFYIRQIARILKEGINSVRRELANLERIGVIAYDKDYPSKTRPQSPRRQRKKFKKKTVKKQELKKFYQTNNEFVLYNELKNLILKSELMIKNGLARKLDQLGKLKLLLLTGRFVEDETASTDILIVGSINRQKLSSLMRRLEKSLGGEIRYTILTQKEYNYRKEITDKFLYKVLDGEKIVVLDKLNK